MSEKKYEPDYLVKKIVGTIRFIEPEGRVYHVYVTNLTSGKVDIYGVSTKVLQNWNLLIPDELKAFIEYGSPYTIPEAVKYQEFTCEPNEKINP
jgi:hypothetical protein